MEAPRISRPHIPRPVHLRSVTWTVCGLTGIDHSAIAASRFRERVTCKRCRAWMAKNPEKEGGKS